MDNEINKDQPQSELLDKINPGGQSRTSSFFSFLWDLVKTFIIVMLIAFAIRYFVIQPFVVDGDSMLPSFINNEYLIAEKISYDFQIPHRGDVMIFRYPKNPQIIYIKRVIGLPGEVVEIKENKVFIAQSPNDQAKPLAENYLSSSVKTEVFASEAGEKSAKIVLADNEFFVLGDNREHSSDSREWGILPRANIIGRVWITVTPLDRFKFWEHISYSDLVSVTSKFFAPTLESPRLLSKE